MDLSILRKNLDKFHREGKLDNVFEQLNEHLKDNTPVSSQIKRLQFRYNLNGTLRRNGEIDAETYRKEIIDIGFVLIAEFNRITPNDIKQKNTKPSENENQNDLKRQAVAKRFAADSVPPNAPNRIIIFKEAITLYAKFLKFPENDLPRLLTKSDDELRSSIAYLNDLAKCYIATEDYPNAILLLQKITILKPNDIQSVTELATCYRETYEIEKALRILQEGLLIQPSNNHFHFGQLIIYLFFLQDAQKAEEIIRIYEEKTHEKLIKSDKVAANFKKFIRELTLILNGDANDKLTKDYYANLISYKSYKNAWYLLTGLVSQGKVENWTIEEIEIVKNKRFAQFRNNILTSERDRFNKAYSKIKENIKNQERNREFSKSLPLSVRSIEITRFQGIKYTSLKIPDGNKWIFVTGENGFGKTTILQSIAIGLHGRRDGTQVLFDEINENSVIKLVYREKTIWIQNEIQNKGIEVESISHKQEKDIEFKPLQIMACYGASRLNPQRQDALNEEKERSSVTYSLFNPDGTLLNIEHDLVLWKYKEDSRFEQVVSIFKQLADILAEVRVNTSSDRVEYQEKEPDEDGSVYDIWLPFGKLASGLKSIINMVGDMIVRLSDRQPDTLIHDLSGIIIIDEFDLHLHPKWQKKLPAALSQIFPKIQFIATTHSVIPLLGAPKESVFLKVNRTSEHGITIEQLDIDVKNLLPNILFTSDLFGMDAVDIRSVQNTSPDKARLEETEEEMKQNDSAWKNHNELAKNNPVPDNLFEKW